MKFKREIIIISLIIAMLFTVSAVCAANSEIQAISAHNSTDTVVSTANDDNLKMNDANEILAETDDGSFAALNTKISGATAGSTVYLENDYEYSSSDNITSGIFIDKNLIIDGQGHKIDAKQKSRIFDCSPYAVVDVTLKNIIFLNGKADYGGALYWYPDGGESNIINCTFIGNSASGSYGGGATINEQDGISNIINCTFIDNHDTNCALYLSSTNVINSVFLNNGGTTLYGPNIEADYNWFGNTIDNYDTAPSVRTSSALNNWYVLNMTTNGANNVATLTLNNLYDRSEIKPCDSYALPSVTFNVEGTNATLNKDAVTLDSNGKASFGFTVTEDTGKLTASTSDVSLSKDVVNMADEGTMAALNTKITDAISNGESEVKLYNDYVYNDSELVKNTINNGNSNNGIGIATDFTIDGQGYTIDGNNRGGRIFYIFAQSKLVTLKNINFVNCTDGYGGVFYAAYCDLRVINCTFTNSTVTANPGGVSYVSYPVTVEIINSTFIKNKAPSGGAIFVFGAQTTNVLVNNSIFINNIATNNVGSAVYCNKYGSYTINNCILLNNTGYAVYNNNAQSTLNVDYNWWGNTIENSDDWEVVSSYDENAYDNWVYLDVIIDDINSLATIKLNNLYTYGVGPSAYDYDLPKITLNVQTTNANINTNTDTLDENGQATINYEMTENEGTLKVSYVNVEITKDIKLFVQDSFTSLKRQIDECEESTFYLHQNYTYDSDFDENLTNGIEITKSITIDGNGYAIDGKGLKNIFYFDDNTNAKDLILKNIIFVNATATTNGAAVYFKGNKIEIINCIFINNKANSQGDAVYVADASSSDNKITESRFTNNSGENSVVYINLESANVKLNLSNSIFLNNDAAYDVKGTEDVIANYNWWGTTTEDYTTNSPKVDGATLNNWYVLNVTANTNTNVATVSLNNLYDGNTLTVYENYALPAIKFNVKGTGVIPDVDTITLSDGSSNFGFTLDVADSSLTLGYADIWQTTTEIHYVIVDDGSFKALYDLIRLTPENGVLDLTKNYTYSETDTITLGIPITKTITINGNDYTINADGKSRIFLINSDNIAFNDIIFINGVSENGGAIYSTVDYNYLNIDNCTFINNTATNTDGGAIWSGSYYFGSVTNSKFINNTAVEDGGAIFSYSYYTYATIDGCTFINNTGSLSSVMYAWVCKIQNSVFLNNSGNMISGKYDSYKQINYNWFGNTVENYNTQPSMTSPITGWLYLNMKFLEDVAIVSLNNLYTSSSSSTSVYSNYNLPEITLNINSTTLNLNTDRITLDSTGKAIVPYTKIEDDAKLTVSNDYVSLTKDCLVGEFDVLQELIDTAVGDTVELNRNYTFIEGVDSLTNGISITRDITIDGKGHTIDGSNLARIFSITTNGVTLKNINFVNGYASHGGAIYNNAGSGFKLINCTFENNTANNEHGGAIYTYSKGVNDFINCTFIGNKITASSQRHGGAIYVNEVSGQNNFIGCTFINNTATRNGGAIALCNGKAVTNIDKSVFITNTAVFYHSIYCDGGVSAEFYLNNSIIFSKDSSTQVYVASSVGAGDVNNNWWMHTSDNYNQNMYIRYSGGGLSVTKWLFLDMNCEDEIATISINNLYDSSAQASSTYDGELPQITFGLSGVNVDIEDNATLNKNGMAEVEYDLTAQMGSITATYNSVSLTKSVVFDDSFTSLQHKITSASEGSELVLYGDYNYDGTKDTGLTEGIVIDKDLTIDGQGFTLDAKDASRIFKINDNTKNIVLKNIRFTNASGDNGAAVYANCNNIEVINCTFEANEATNNGDALYVIADSCDITESTFINNLGTSSALYLASDLQDAPFNIDNSILVNNQGTDILKDDKIALTANNNWWGNTVDSTADLSGGIAQNWYILDMTVDNSQSIATVSLNNLWDGSTYSPCETYALPTITANIQTNDYASARKDKVTIDKDGDTVGYIVTDETNAGEITVSYNGVSITREISYDEDADYSFKALKKLIDAAQDNDTIELQHDYEYVIGYDDITSGIGIIQKNLTINGNGFTIDAKGQTRIFNVGISDNTIQGSNLTIKNTTFVNGKMSADGGAISWYGDDGNLANCTFVNNTVTGYKSGGAVNIQSKNMVVFNVTFSENKADTKGGAIYIYSDNVTISQSTFVKSDGGGNGGAIYWGKCDNGTIINSTFIDNYATEQGGALEIGTNAGDITVVNSTFIKNKVTSTAGKGAAIYWGSPKNRNIINSTFRDNYASSQGGALYWYTMNEGYNGIMYNSTFINNTALNGGAIYIFSGRLDIDESDFINNTATGGSTAYGGAIYDGGDSLNINNSAFMGNAANAASSYGRGGALYVSEYGKLNINNSTFIKNSAYSKSSTSGGGVMYIINSKCNITNSTFISNSATVGGSSSTYGGVFYWYGAKGNISNSVFIDNSAKNYGGVIYGSQSASNMNVTNSIFINNKLSTSNSVNVMNAASSGFYNFTECWFGNTRLDGYAPIGLSTNDYIKSNLPLCLELDSYMELMIVDDDKEISYYFNYFEDGTIHDYDSSKLPEVNLTLSTVKADVDKNHALVDDTILFNANQYGSVSITAEFYGLEYTEELTAKLKVIITVDENPIVVHVGEHKDVTGISLDPVTLYFTTSVAEGDEYIEIDEKFKLAGLKEGESILTITTSGDSTHAPTTLKVPVTVIKYNTELATLIDLNPVDSIAVDWGAEPQSIQIGFNTDDPNPDYASISYNFASNDTNVAKFSTNPSLITFGTAGTANITFYLEENEKYYGSEKSITVTVRKVESSVTVPPVEVTYGSTNTSTLTFNGATGVTAALYDGDTEITGIVSVEGNVVTIDAANLDVNTYTLSVTTVPDENHTSVTETTDVIVNPAGSDVTVPESSSVTYGSSVDVTVTVPEGGNASGVTAKLYLGGDEITGVVSVDGLKVTVDATSLDVGTYTLKVTTITDNNHASVTREGNVVVGQAGSDATVPNSANVGYTESVDVVVSNPVNASGITAKLYLGDDEVAGVVSVDGLKVTVNALSLNVGEYTLKVTTIPVDDNHAPVTHECIVTVNKIDSEVIFIPAEITFAYEDEGLTVATCTGCTIDDGNVTILNHPEAIIRVDGNKITVSGLDEGEYTMNVITTPDSNHKSIETTLKVTVRGISPKMDMMVSNITVGEKLNVYITMDTEATGIVNITIFHGTEIIQSRNITINNRFNKTEFEGLKVGNYTIIAFYYGSLNYNEATVPDEFTVHPIYTFEFSAEVNDTVCGNTTNATINLSPDATGSIQIGTAVHPIEGAVTVIELPVQNRAGKNSVTVKYIPDKDSKYGAREIVVYYNVVKKPTEITIADIGDKKAGDEVAFEVSSYPNAQIVLYFDGVKLDSNTIENISAGTHTIMANVAETEQYLSGTANKTFTVTKTDVVLSVSGTNQMVHEKFNITVEITSGVTGTVIVNINGTDYVLDASDIKPIEVAFDKAGTASLSVKYLGDYKFNAKDAVGEDIVISDKAQANITVSDLPSDIKAGDSFNVTITNNTAVVVYVDGKPQSLVDGKVKVSNVSAGNHNITVVAAETPQYYGNQSVRTFVATKKAVTIKIDGIVNKKAGDNVTVKVSAYDDANITVYVDGVKTDNVNNISAGNHTIVAIVDETYEYLPATANKTFEVTKKNIGLFTISSNDVVVGEEAVINVYITDDNAAGIVIINVNGTEYSLKINSIETQLKVVMNQVGNFSLSATYLENDKYNAQQAFCVSRSINVKDKSDSKIVINDPTLTIGEPATLTATVNGNAAQLVYTINGVAGNVINTVEATTYTVTASFAGNSTHKANSTTKEFTVPKYDSEIVSVYVEPVIKDGESTIEVTVNTGASGKVIIEIDGLNYTASIGNDGKATLDVTLDKTTDGKVYYLGDDKYNAAAPETFTAVVNDKEDSTVTINDMALTIGESAKITAAVNGKACADLVYTINGVATDTIENIRPIDYVVTASFAGNSTHKAGSASRTFTVSKLDSQIKTVNVAPVIKDAKSKIEVAMNGKESGSVIIEINGVNYTAKISNAKASLEIVLDKTTSGKVYYLGDETYKAAASKTFTAVVNDKADSTVAINDVNLEIGKSATVTGTVNGKTAPLTFTINGVETSRIAKVEATTYVVTASFAGNATHKSATASKTFKVDKKPSSVIITVEGDLTVDSNVNINVESYDGADITVYLDGRKLSNWKQSFKAVAGEHMIVATAAENDEYLSSSDNYTFTVAKKQSKVFVSGTPAIVGQDSIIDVEINSDATGMVVVTVDGTEYSLDLKEAKSLAVSLAKAGVYDISAKYLGDDRYLPSESETNTLVVEDKKNSEILINAPATAYAGDSVEIEVTSTGDARLEVYFDGVKQTLVNDKFTVSNIASGNHLIEVTSPETSGYKYNATSKRINAVKKQSEVTITLPKTITIGKDVTVEFRTTSDAAINAYVDGEKQTLTNGKVTFKATAGEHTVTADVAETDKYLSASVEKKFTVKKLDEQIAVTGTDITEGQTAELTITTMIDEGLAVIRVGDTELAVDLAKTKTANVKLDIAGTYELSASYLGSDTYNPVHATKSAIKVSSKQSADITVDIPEIKANESKPISISVPNGKGSVSVIVDGVENTVPLDANGRATFTLPTMGAGSHDVVVAYPGDDTNAAAIVTQSFDVEKQATQASITTPSDVKEGENANVNVKIPGATGEVSIIVDGEENKVPLVNGEASYPLNNLSGGEHSVVVIYPGDEASDATYASSSFDVAKKPVIVKKASEFSDITVADDLRVSFILKDEDGNPIRNAVIKYFDGEDKTIKTDARGMFTVQAKNGVLITIEYEGTDTIIGTSTAFKLNVPIGPAPVVEKIETHFDIPGGVITLKGYAVDTKAGEEGINYATKLLDSNGNPIEGMKIQFAVNDKIYDRTTNAEGSFTPYKLNMVRVGRYTMAFYTMGNENYTGAFASVCVDLDKKPISIKAPGKVSSSRKYTVSLSTIVGSSHDGKVHLRSGMNVKLTVNGKTLNAKTNAKGKATFKLTGLANGRYSATVSYVGDLTYEAAEKSVIIKV